MRSIWGQPVPLLYGGNIALEPPTQTSMGVFEPTEQGASAASLEMRRIRRRSPSRSAWAFPVRQTPAFTPQYWALFIVQSCSSGDVLCGRVEALQCVSD